jgi:hypothetical protein
MKTSPSLPRNVILIASEVPLIDEGCSTLGDRPVAHANLLARHQPFAAWAMTVATGQSPLRHGIFSDSVVDFETLRPRETRAADRHFPAIWNTAATTGLTCTAIGWPATDGDDALENPTCMAEITKDIKTIDSTICAAIASTEIPAEQQASERLRGSLTQNLLRVQATSEAVDRVLRTDQPPAFIAWTYRCARINKKSSPAVRQSIEAAFAQSLTLLKPETLVFVVQQDGHKSRLSIIGAPTQPPSIEPLPLGAVASAARAALGVPLPLGTPPIDLRFVGIPIGPMTPAALPIGATESNEDIVDLATRIVDLPKGAPRKRAILIVRRLATTAAKMAQNGHQWSRAAVYSRALVLLNGTPQDHWRLVLSLQRLQKSDELAAAATAFASAFPDIPASHVGTALTLIKSEPAQAAAIVAAIDVDTVKLDGVIGAMGRVLVQCGEKSKGHDLLRIALDRGAGIPTDRLLIARDALDDGDAEYALTILAQLGKHRGEPIRARLLRGEILIAIDRFDEAKAIATELVKDYPSEASSEALMRKATAVR